ncbi:MAG TPA: apolipoprotein N-acyltransferase [Candidatus Obscuribacterales bacterium]
MQSSGLEVEQAQVAPRPGLVERLSWTDKIPIALGCGCLLGLSAPGFDVWWLAWIGLAPLLVLIQGCRGRAEAAVVGFSFGMGYNLVALGWYLGLYPLRWMGLEDWIAFQAVVLVWVIEAVHQSLLMAGTALLVFVLPMRAGFVPFYRRPYFPYVLSVPVLWVFFQWVLATQEAFLGVPVNQLAYSQCRQLELIQSAKLGGSQLIDFLLVAANAALAALIVELSGWAPRLADRCDRLSPKGGAAVDLAAVALAVGLLFVWGKAEMARVAELTTLIPDRPRAVAPPVPLAVIQGNISIEEERLGSLSAREASQRYMQLCRGLGVPLIVFPEGVIGAAQSASGLLASQLHDLTAAEKKEAVVGSVEQLEGRPVNAARLVTAAPVKEKIYVKRRLVPFGEFVPGGPLADLLPSRVKELLMGGSPGFVSARSAYLLSSVWGKVGASICVEVIYPRLIADEVRQGASLLVNVSNLAWFHGSTLNRQVLAAAILRAVENGRYLVLATNTGISAVVDPAGVVTSVSIPGKRGVLIDTVQFLYKKTPFTKMWWL